MAWVHELGCVGVHLSVRRRTRTHPHVPYAGSTLPYLSIYLSIYLLILYIYSGVLRTPGLEGRAQLDPYIAKSRARFAAPRRPAPSATASAASSAASRRAAAVVPPAPPAGTRRSARHGGGGDAEEGGGGGGGSGGGGGIGGGVGLARVAEAEDDDAEVRRARFVRTH
jgi:uncharacterized membrane protein YgcG